VESISIVVNGSQMKFPGLTTELEKKSNRNWELKISLKMPWQKKIQGL